MKHYGPEGFSLYFPYESGSCRVEEKSIFLKMHFSYGKHEVAMVNLEMGVQRDNLRSHTLKRNP